MQVPFHRRTLSFLLLVALLGSGSVFAGLRLPAVFSDHAVLQQGRSLPVWGWADPGTEVTVVFRGRQVTTTAPERGPWLVRLPRQRPGGPDTLTVQAGAEQRVLTNILVGEVWVASGQSNMEWPMHRTENPEPAIAASANPQIRLFTVPKRKAQRFAEDVEARWVLCEPENVRNFSAVAYYFGRDLQAARGVPVGLIHTSWGGSPAEVWIREDTLASVPEFQRDLLDPIPERERQLAESVAAWEAEAARLRAEGKQPTRGRPGAPWRPSELYNGMIAPLIPYAIRGALWYQGESNAGRADQYTRLFPTLIRNWRTDWGQGDFPFLFVQLAPWDKNRQRPLEAITAAPGDSDWAELREAQWITTRILPHTGMAVITDLGDKDDIHPMKKEPVGARLALLARSIAYRERLVSSGPEFRRLSLSRGRAILSFDHVGGGLEARGGPLTGFQICGSDREWVWADAEIQRSRVIVSSPQVPEPIAVRYGWSDFPVVNLFNREGLPATPFRTDNFPATTVNRR